MAVPLTLPAVYRFFVPLAVMSTMMLATSTIIHAALARLPEPKIALAAFAVGMSFHGALGGPIWAQQYIALNYLKDRAALWQIMRFACLWIVILGAVDVIVAFTPVGDWLFGGVFGAGPDVVRQARTMSIILFFEFPLITLRSMAVALIMLNRRTWLMPLGTTVRIASLFGYLLILPALAAGGVVGAAAFTLCVGTETAMLLVLARPSYKVLPATSGKPPPTLRELLRFGWPLMTNMAAEFGIPLLINFFLGRLPRANLALASFGVLNGLVRLLVGSLRNLTHTAQTLSGGRQERRLLLMFAWQAVAVFSMAPLVLFYTPAKGWLLASVMGLPSEMREYLTPALNLSLPVGALLGFGYLFRGMLTAAGNTRPIAFSAGARIGMVALCGAVALTLDNANGAVIGILLLMVAWAGEAVLLGANVLRAAALPGGTEAEPTPVADGKTG